jgi:hypothetical protein
MLRFGLALCLFPISCAAGSNVPGSDGTGIPAPSGIAPASEPSAGGTSGGTSSNATGVVTSVSSSSSGGQSPSGSSGSSGSSGGSGGSSGATPTSGSGGSTSSGGTLGTDGDGGTTTQSKMTPDIFADAGAYSPPAEAGSGQHHPGESCMQSGCHGSGEAQAFLIGGTVYKDYAGTIPYPGVEVRVQDATGKTMTTYSRQNGNFYISGGGAPLALPALVSARDGTTTRPMVTQLTTASMSSCASTGCHTVGGSPSTGAYYPIHVP